jgi:predicted NAD/FAD-dependent oxidoreductase
MRIGIVGAGLAGLACAEGLRQRGHEVRLFDKGRGAGGRMATRRMTTLAGDVSFDHGAQYFTARARHFIDEVRRWQQAGLATPWAEAGPDAWVGTPAMNAPVRQLARAANVQWSAQVQALSRLDDGWSLHGDGVSAARFDAVCIAVPAEQAAPLLAPWASNMAAIAAATRSLPCWTVMAAFAERLAVAPDTLRAKGAIGWAARNSAKPERTGPEAWVIQADPTWSAAHLEAAPDTILPLLLAEFAAATGCVLPTPLVASAHRWRYARSGSHSCGALWDAALGLGVCGDWLLGPRVECAWLSGRQLAENIG